MVMPSALLTATLYPIVATAAVVQTIKAVWPMTGKPGARGGKAILHWHYKGKSGTTAVSHRHPGGGTSHMHRGLPGYGRKKSTLRR